MMMIQDVLTLRGKQYGNFLRLSQVAQALKQVLAEAQRTPLDPDLQISLDMICLKLARIANGDPYHGDNWTDIAGYATLVADRLHQHKVIEGGHTS